MVLQSLPSWLDGLNSSLLPDVSQVQEHRSTAKEHFFPSDTSSFWDPTPSAPDFLHDDLTELLTRELGSKVVEEQPALAHAHSEDSKRDCADVENLDLCQPQEKSSDPVTHASQRKLEVNRAAQKRFRARQKVGCFSKLPHHATSSLAVA